MKIIRQIQFQNRTLYIQTYFKRISQVYNNSSEKFIQPDSYHSTNFSNLKILSNKIFEKISAPS